MHSQPRAGLIDKKVVRKRISEVLLTERLHLDQEWLDPGNVRKRLPKGLPKRLKSKMPEEIKEVEQKLCQLVACGCNRGVLYWCIARMGQREDFFRLGGTRVPPLEEDESGKVRCVSSKLATQEEMKPLVEHAMSARKYIRKFREELLLAADVLAEECPLPDGLWAEGPPDPIEAITVLLNSLKWAQQLASCWAKPSETTLMKSKGILYLSVYVSLHMDSMNPSSSEDPHRKVLTLAIAEAIVDIGGLCGDIKLLAPDLPTKLKRFKLEHPILHARMVALLETLDRVARSNSPDESSSD